MSAQHDDQVLAGAYVLGALDPGERLAYEAHLATCEVCRTEVRSFRRVADALAGSVPQTMPRPELRARVLSAITGEAVAFTAPSAPAARRPISLTWLPLAASIVVAVALGLYARELQLRLSTMEARLTEAEQRASSAERTTIEARRTAAEVQTAMAVLAAPDLVRIDLTGQAAAPAASARALWSRNRGMVFATTNLPAAPPGRVYQVWVVTATAPVSAGFLQLDASGRASAYFSTPADIAPPVAVAVTLEPAGGVPAPTGERYLVGKPAI
ncbi:MAG TPA: anti-sigma factor [Vicinamibacterales bacterium]|jgi:anti-sigma-K factor RskA|nr:anti-sigma factor [Vicinamibacterales bacterium]